MLAKKDTVGKILLLAVLGFTFGLTWLSYDIVMWLRHGSWTALHFGTLLLKMGLKNIIKWVYYSNDWIAVRLIFKYILEMSACFVFMAISAVVFFIGLLVHD